jgi:hypothetical protein
MKSHYLAPLAAVALIAASAVQAQAVKAPPLPPGSNMVRIEAGLNPEEKKRHVRAHHHKGHHKKDVHRDDSLPGHSHGKPPANSNAGGAKK